MRAQRRLVRLGQLNRGKSPARIQAAVASEGGGDSPELLCRERVKRVRGARRVIGCDVPADGSDARDSRRIRPRRGLLL